MDVSADKLTIKDSKNTIPLDVLSERKHEKIKKIIFAYKEYIEAQGEQELHLLFIHNSEKKTPLTLSDLKSYVLERREQLSQYFIKYPQDTKKKLKEELCVVLESEKTDLSSRSSHLSTVAQLIEDQTKVDLFQEKYATTSKTFFDRKTAAAGLRILSQKLTGVAVALTLPRLDTVTTDAFMKDLESAQEELAAVRKNEFATVLVPKVLDHLEYVLKSLGRHYYLAKHGCKFIGRAIEGYTSISEFGALLVERTPEEIKQKAAVKRLCDSGMFTTALELVVRSSFASSLTAVIVKELAEKKFLERAKEALKTIGIDKYKIEAWESIGAVYASTGYSDNVLAVFQEMISLLNENVISVNHTAVSVPLRAIPGYGDFLKERISSAFCGLIKGVVESKEWEMHLTEVKRLLFMIPHERVRLEASKIVLHKFDSLEKTIPLGDELFSSGLDTTHSCFREIFIDGDIYRGERFKKWPAIKDLNEAEQFVRDIQHPQIRSWAMSLIVYPFNPGLALDEAMKITNTKFKAEVLRFLGKELGAENLETAVNLATRESGTLVEEFVIGVMMSLTNDRWKSFVKVVSAKSHDAFTIFCVERFFNPIFYEMYGDFSVFIMELVQTIQDLDKRLKYSTKAVDRMPVCCEELVKNFAGNMPEKMKVSFIEYAAEKYVDYKHSYGHVEKLISFHKLIVDNTQRSNSLFKSVGKLVEKRLVAEARQVAESIPNPNVKEEAVDSTLPPEERKVKQEPSLAKQELSSPNLKPSSLTPEPKSLPPQESSAPPQATSWSILPSWLRTSTVTKKM